MDGIRIVSAGFLASDRPSPEAAVRIANERGIDLSEHRSRTVDHDVMAGPTLVIGMEAAHQRKARRRFGRSARVVHLGDLDPELPTRRDIVDPWGRADDVFHASFDRVERCVRALQALLEDDRAP